MSTLTRLSEKFSRLSIEKNKEFFSVRDVQQMIDEEIKAIEKSREGKPRDVFPFGKYRGKKIQDVATIDKPYLEWVMKQPWFEKFTDIKSEVKKYL